MRLDDLLPAYDFVEIHSVLVRATPERVGSGLIRRSWLKAIKRKAEEKVCR